MNPLEQKKHREFWIDNTSFNGRSKLDRYDEYFHSCINIKPMPFSNWIHVIEYSALEEMEKRAEELAKQRDVYLKALESINKQLSVPAAEYVPAIGDAFDTIDKAIAEGAKIRGEG